MKLLVSFPSNPGVVCKASSSEDKLIYPKNREPILTTPIQVLTIPRNTNMMIGGLVRKLSSRHTSIVTNRFPHFLQSNVSRHIPFPKTPPSSSAIEFSNYASRRPSIIVTFPLHSRLVASQTDGCLMRYQDSLLFDISVYLLLVIINLHQQNVFYLMYYIHIFLYPLVIPFLPTSPVPLTFLSLSQSPRGLHEAQNIL